MPTKAPKGGPGPKTLEELAALAEITMADIELFSEKALEELLADELEIKAKPRAKLKQQHRDLLEAKQAAGDAADRCIAAVVEGIVAQLAATEDEIAAVVEEMVAKVAAADAAQTAEPPRKSCATCVAGLKAALHKARDDAVERFKAWKQRKKDQMTMFAMACCHFCCWRETQEQRQAWVASQARLSQVHPEPESDSGSEWESGPEPEPEPAKT